MSSGLSNFDYRMFDMARRVATESSFDSFHLGCVVTYKRHIIASASNSNKSHPMQKRYNRKRNFNKTDKAVHHSGHAEILALANIPYTLLQTIDWRKVKVYVYRISNGKLLKMGLARSCPACMAALRDRGIQHLYYTTDDGYCYERIM